MKINYFNHFLLFVFMLLIMGSCLNGLGTQDNLPNYKFQSSIKDSLVLAVIREFISNYNVDRSQEVLDLTIDKNILTLSKSEYFCPSCEVGYLNYTIVDSVMVLITSSISPYLEMKDIQKEIEQVSSSFGIKIIKNPLEEINVLEHPVTWYVILCDHSINKIYKNDWPKFRLPNIPCGYYIEYDSTNFDKLKILKEK